jgi:hypothetical protein
MCNVDLALSIEGFFKSRKSSTTAVEFAIVHARLDLQGTEQEIPHAQTVLSRQLAAALGGCGRVLALAAAPVVHRPEGPEQLSACITARIWGASGLSASAPAIAKVMRGKCASLRRKPRASSDRSSKASPR